MTQAPAMISGAQFSDDRVYRYALWRTWDETKGHAMFIGLNPSTADETKDDQTIRKCMAFARRWDYGGIYMLNIFAFRATDPQVMKAAADPIGPGNDDIIRRYLACAGTAIACWGVHGQHRNRSQRVRAWLRGRLHHLGLTKDGHPKHPLYLPLSTPAEVWS